MHVTSKRMNQSGYQTVIVEIELEPKIIVAPHIDSELRRLQSGPAGFKR